MPILYTLEKKIATFFSATFDLTEDLHLAKSHSDYFPYEQPIHYAVRQGHLEAIQALFQAGVSVNQWDSGSLNGIVGRKNPLMYAFEVESAKNQALIHLLLQMGANPLLHNERGFSAMHYSLYTKCPNIFIYLLRLGFNPLSESESPAFKRALYGEMGRLAEDSLEAFRNIMFELAKTPTSQSDYAHFETQMRCEIARWCRVIQLKNASVEQIRRQVPVVSPGEPRVALTDPKKQHYLLHFEKMSGVLDEVRRDIDKRSLLTYFHLGACVENRVKQGRLSYAGLASDHNKDGLPMKRLPTDLQRELCDLLLGPKRRTIQ